jgi:hypothetical protein
MVEALDQARIGRSAFRTVCYACCRSIQHLLTDPRLREAIAQVEAFAKGELPEVKRLEAFLSVAELVEAHPGRDEGGRSRAEAAEYLAALTVYFSLWCDSRHNHGDREGVEYVLGRAAAALAWAGGADELTQPEEWDRLHDAARAEQAGLLRAMFGGTSEPRARSESDPVAPPEASKTTGK